VATTLGKNLILHMQARSPRIKIVTDRTRHHLALTETSIRVGYYWQIAERRYILDNRTEFGESSQADIGHA
jgi:hypothetical protein